jgi:hypothetical protein
MGSFELGMLLSTVIAARFHEGLMGWCEAGCAILVVPRPAEKDCVYVLLPADTTAEFDLAPFMETLEEISERGNFTCRFVKARNFEGMDPNDIKGALEEPSSKMPLEHLIGVYCDPSVLVISARSHVDEKDTAETTLGLLSGVQGLLRAVYHTPTFFRERVYAAPSLHTEETREPLTEQDVANISTMLEGINSIDQLLERM